MITSMQGSIDCLRKILRMNSERAGLAHIQNAAALSDQIKVMGPNPTNGAWDST
jgi:hypothetical protein